MNTNVFKVTPLEVQAVINPANSPKLFTFGDTSMSNADALVLLQTSEDMVLSYIPPRYKQKITQVDGEVLTDYARDDETTFQLSLYPVTEGKVKLYKNLPVTWTKRNWTHEILSSDYSCNVDTGQIILSEALKQGDTLIAEYKHDAAFKFTTLKKFVIDWSAFEVSSRFNFFKRTEDQARFQAIRDNTRQQLLDLWYNKISIPQLDNIRFVNNSNYTSGPHQVTIPIGEW